MSPIRELCITQRIGSGKTGERLMTSQTPKNPDPKNGLYPKTQELKYNLYFPKLRKQTDKHPSLIVQFELPN
jgi:hypothetical protein